MTPSASLRERRSSSMQAAPLRSKVVPVASNDAMISIAMHHHDREAITDRSRGLPRNRTPRNANTMQNASRRDARQQDSLWMRDAMCWRVFNSGIGSESAINVSLAEKLHLVLRNRSLTRRISLRLRMTRRALLVCTWCMAVICHSAADRQASGDDHTGGSQPKC